MPGAGHPCEPLPPMRLGMPGPPGCPAAVSSAEQEGEGRDAYADLIGVCPAGALAGLPAALPRFEALPESPHGEAGQVRDSGHGELPRGRGGTAAFIHGGTLVPGRNPRTGAAARAAGGKAYP
jgi:hypothetical protein